MTTEIKNNEQVTETTVAVVENVTEEKKESKAKGFFKKVGSGVKKHGKTALALGGGLVAGLVASAVISKIKDRDSDDSEYDVDYDEDVIDVEYDDVEEETEE